MNNVYFGYSNLDEVFGGEYSNTGSTNSLVEKNSPWSGKVTFIDNGGTSDYDVVKVEVGAPAVIDDVSAKGKVTFKNTVATVAKDKVTLDFDDSDETQLIKLTKDGKAIEWSELKEWDVLSILYNSNTEGYYDVRVVGSNAIDGSVSSKASIS